MTLFEEVEAIWGPKHVAMAERWASQLAAGLPAIDRASKLFHRWGPLSFHVSLGEVGQAGQRKRSPKLNFSLRHRGQEVATLEVGEKPTIVISDSHAANNATYFKLKTPPDRIPWSSATDFRALFEVPKPGAHVRIPEHELEARTLEELGRRDGTKRFAGSHPGARHCGPTSREYPIQFPLPVSANRGFPEDSRGNMDIVVRQRQDGKVRLAIWELKRPGVVKDAVAQSYIYAVTVALILRSSSGPAWYRLFGFTRPIPKVLEIEAVAVVSPAQEVALRASFKRLEPRIERSLPELATTVVPFAHLLDPETLSIRRIAL